MNYLEETVGSGYCSNGGSIQLKNLTPGKEYTIKVYQRKNFTHYTMVLK